MGRVYGIELPKGLAKQLNAVLRAVPEVVLREAAAQHFGKADGESDKLQNRLAGMIGGAGDLPVWLIDLLRPYVPFAHAIGCLSVETVDGVLDDLCVLRGSEQVVLAGLIDRRDAVRLLAQARLQKRFGRPGAKEREAARARLSERLGDLAGLCSEEPPEATTALVDRTPPEEPPRPPDDGEAGWGAEEMRQRLIALEERERDLKDQLKQKDNESRRLRQAKEKKLKDSQKQERERLETEIRNLADRERKAASETSDLRRQLDHELRQREETIQQEVEKRTSVALRPWLERPSAVADYELQRSGSVDELLRRTRLLLQEQSKRDKTAGHRRRLDEKLAELRSVLEAVVDARENSLHPLPGLADAGREIEAEIAAIEGRLRRGATPEPATKRLTARINDVQDLKGLETCRRLAEELARADLISARDRQQLDAELHRRLTLLQDKAAFRSAPGDRLDGWQLGGTLHRNRKAVLFIDGHNVIFRFHGRALDKPNRDYERVLREELIACVETLLRPRDSVRARIVFDGPRAGSESRLSNLTIEYSGGARSEADRADRIIEAHLQHLRQADRRAAIFVVSDDLRLAVAAQVERAHLVTTAQFRYFLERYDALDPMGGGAAESA